MAKSSWVTGEFNRWTSKVERVSDGWILRLTNNSPFPAAFIVLRFELYLEKKDSFLFSQVAMFLISESVANPGQEVVFKLAATRKFIPELVGKRLKIQYGVGVGPHCDQYEIVLN